MQRNRVNPGNRLMFESNVVRQVRHERQRPPKIGRLVALLVLVGIVVGFAIWVSQFFHGVTHGKDAVAIGKMAATVLDALKNDTPNMVRDISADSEPGRALIQQDDQKRAKNPGQVEPASTDTGGNCVAFLMEARDSLAQQGLAWEHAKPLAFGGVRAELLESQAMKNPAVAVTGVLYFEADGAVYALELTARVCGDAAVITDFWKCAVTDVKPEGVEADAAARFRAFNEEQVSAKEPAAIKRSTSVFVPLHA